MFCILILFLESQMERIFICVFLHVGPQYVFKFNVEKVT